MDYSELAERLQLDEESIYEMLELFLDTSRSDLEMLVKGVEENQADQVVHAAHSIKGAAMGLCMDEISVLAKALEHDARQNDLTDAADACKTIKMQLDALAEDIEKYKIVIED